MCGVFLNQRIEQTLFQLLWKFEFMTLPGPLQPHTMHISCKNKSIPGMQTDFGKTQLYTLKESC